MRTKIFGDVEPFFVDKTPMNSTHTVESNNIISDSVFSEAAIKLDIDRDLYTEKGIYTSDPVKKSVVKYTNHPSILKLNEEDLKLVIFEFTPIYLLFER